jgi:Outer membrane protein beta-barrel domain
MEYTMKRILLLLAVTIFTASSLSAGVGVGAFGGLAIPIAQDDQDKGKVFGLKARLKAIPLFAIEPYLSFAKYGDKVIEGLVGGEFKGSKVNSYGVDALLGAPMGGPGLKPYVILGAGFFSTKADETNTVVEDKTRLGLSGGLGFDIGFGPTFSVDARGKLNVISQEEGGSKKSATITVGATLFLGM